ncbi:LAMI_0D12156g1_1 [Lachancea mirantina]|uniref:LAMI_0D12156g1_1 n=1 Tax=Lachancea mirantina TaxID=1230905 RepID=A0A1G4JG31_9SACH|nr:LAMI_0D12156g1_1 [Lachancea mirantina]
MNTPKMNEQLTPKLSPTMMHLDDTIPALNAPSFMCLDDAKAYPLMYRTSLSKLNEKGRQGRGRTSGPETPTRLLRSNSPIRAMLNHAPKMLKPEYMGRPTLFGKNTGSIATPSMILASSKLNFETLQRPVKVTNAKVEEEQPSIEMLEPGVERCKPVRERPGRKHKRGNSTASTTVSGATACESLQEPQMPLKAPLKRGGTNTSSNPGYRFPSENSTASSSSTLDIQEIPAEFAFDTPMDKAEFVLATQNKRDSYMSSVGSTQDDDLGGWFAQYVEEKQSNLALSVLQEKQEETIRADKTVHTEQITMRIKQLEFQINELKLQNDELRHSMTAHRSLQDRYMFEALHDAHREKELTKRDMDRRMKQLEKQVENYKKVIKKLTNKTQTTDVSKSRLSIVSVSTLDGISEADTKDGYEANGNENQDQDDDDDDEQEDNENSDRINTSTIASDINAMEPSSPTRIKNKKPSGFDLKLSLQV